MDNMIGKIDDAVFVWAGGVGYAVIITLIGLDTISTVPIPYWPSSLGVLAFVASTLLLWPQIRAGKITFD